MNAPEEASSKEKWGEKTFQGFKALILDKGALVKF